MAKISKVVHENELRIKIAGEFTSKDCNDFRQTYENLETESKLLVVDFSMTKYLDSLALGSLLSLRSYLVSNGVEIALHIGDNKLVSDTFDTFNMSKIFKII